MDSRWIDLDGPVHYAEWAGPDDGPSFVLVHGLGGSHANWLSVAPGLARRGRVLAPDLAGFGRTPPAGRRSTLGANRRLLHRFLQATEAAPAILAGNSMGGAIAALEAAREPESVAGLVLVDPALPRARATTPDAAVAALFATYLVPGVGEQFVKRRARLLGPEGMVRETLRMCCVDPGRVDPAVVAAHVALARDRAEMPWAPHTFLEAARSILRRLARRQRHLAVLRAVACPTLLLHGRHDRLVPLAAALEAARMRPDWSVHVFDHLGHVPQLEDPAAWLAAVEAWLEGPGAAAVTISRGGSEAAEASG